MEVERSVGHASIAHTESLVIQDRVKEHVVETVVPAADLISKRDHQYLCVTFLLVGTSALFYWNSALNTLYAVLVGRYAEFSGMSDIFTGIYTAAACVTAISLAAWGVAARPIFHYVGGVVLMAMCLVFAGSVSMSGVGGLTVMYLGSAVAGVSEMFFQVSGYALAVSLPRNYANWLSFGYGACGIITFCLWMLLSQGIFKIESTPFSHTQGAVWTQFVFAAVLIACSLLAMFTLLRRPSMRAAIEAADIYGKRGGKTPEHDLEAQDSSEDQEGFFSWLPRVLRASWASQFGLGLLFVIVMFNYPNIGPYQWGLDVKRNDILTGMNQTGEFIGRMLCTAAASFPFLVLPERWLLPLTVLKVIFPILAILTAQRARDGKTDDILYNYGVLVFLILINSFTTGWYATCFMIRVPEKLSQVKDKARASSLAIGILVAAISVGLWLEVPVKINPPAW